MDKRHVSRIAAAVGLPEVPEDWSGIDAVWLLLERMKSEGAVVLVKLDGARGPLAGPYTVFASGGLLDRNSLRADEHTVEAALVHVIVNYAAAAWGISLPA